MATISITKDKQSMERQQLRQQAVQNTSPRTHINASTKRPKHTKTYLQHPFLQKYQEMSPKAVWNFNHLQPQPPAVSGSWTLLPKCHKCQYHHVRPEIYTPVTDQDCIFRLMSTNWCWQQSYALYRQNCLQNARCWHEPHDLDGRAQQGSRVLSCAVGFCIITQ